jgi:hypothetical protein
MTLLLFLFSPFILYTHYLHLCVLPCPSTSSHKSHTAVRAELQPGAAVAARCSSNPDRARRGRARWQRRRGSSTGGPRRHSARGTREQELWPRRSAEELDLRPGRARHEGAGAPARAQRRGAESPAVRPGHGGSAGGSRGGVVARRSTGSGDGRFFSPVLASLISQACGGSGYERISRGNDGKSSSNRSNRGQDCKSNRAGQLDLRPCASQESSSSAGAGELHLQPGAS